jgi:uncharacterized pyridoxamine 5'-phosphate oxidase family protein
MSKELSDQVIDLLNREATIVIVSTVDEDGCPRTAPFGWVYAKDSKTILFSTSRGHDTYKNIVRDGRVMVCLLDEFNTAISIKGNARVCKEQLETISWNIAVVEIEITDVKNDVTRVASVVSGIKCEINERYVEMTDDVYAEMMNACRKY